MSFRRLHFNNFTLYPIGASIRYRKRATVAEDELARIENMNSCRVWIANEPHNINGEVRGYINRQNDRISKLELRNYALNCEADWSAQQMLTLRQDKKQLWKNVHILKTEQAEVEARRGEREDEFLHVMANYIGLGNVVESFIDMTPDHMLYDAIRQDIKDYLSLITAKENEET